VKRPVILLSVLLVALLGLYFGFQWLRPAPKQALITVTFDMGGGKAGFAATIYAQEVSTGETYKGFYSAGSHGLVVLPSEPISITVAAPGRYVFYATLINNPDDYHYGATGCQAGADCPSSDLQALDVLPGQSYQVTIADRAALLPTPGAPVSVP
jgi:hypothetical protein